MSQDRVWRVTKGPSLNGTPHYVLADSWFGAREIACCVVGNGAEVEEVDGISESPVVICERFEGEVVVLTQRRSVFVPASIVELEPAP